MGWITPAISLQQYVSFSFLHTNMEPSTYGRTSADPTSPYWLTFILFLLFCSFRIPLDSLVHTSFSLFTTASMESVLRSGMLSQGKCTGNFASWSHILLNGVYTIIHFYKPSQQNMFFSLSGFAYSGYFICMVLATSDLFRTVFFHMFWASSTIVACVSTLFILLTE